MLRKSTKPKQIDTDVLLLSDLGKGVISKMASKMAAMILNSYISITIQC